jgi:hypothetical protein
LHADRNATPNEAAIPKKRRSAEAHRLSIDRRSNRDRIEPRS